MPPRPPPDPAALAGRWQRVRAEVARAARRHGRDPASVRVLAVSKRQDAATVRALARAGARAFGENYLQEARAKMAVLTEPDLEWHFIGRLQSNKTREVAARFDWVHTVDRPRIAERLSAQRPDHLPPLKVLIEVNVSGEASKGGVAPEGLAPLAHAVATLPRLDLCGLMCLPAPATDPDAQRLPFARLAALAATLREQGLAVDELSMGTSSDFAAAIAEGATIVRLGTALFGARDDRPAGACYTPGPGAGSPIRDA